MQLRRHFKNEIEWLRQYGDLPAEARAKVARQLEPAPYIRVVSSSKFWNVTQNVIDKGVLEGWLAIGGGNIVLNAVLDPIRLGRAEEPPVNFVDVTYKILRVPGHYCCHCNEKIEDDGRGTQAREHLRTAHFGVESPDPQNPSGWRRDSFYRCELVAGIAPDTTGNEVVTKSYLRRFLESIRG